MESSSCSTELNHKNVTWQDTASSLSPKILPRVGEMKSALCLLVCRWITACEIWSEVGLKAQKETPFRRIRGDDKQKKTHIMRQAPARPLECHSFLQGNLLGHCHTDTHTHKHNNYGLHSKGHSSVDLNDKGQPCTCSPGATGISPSLNPKL